MSPTDDGATSDADIVLEYELDAPPEKVWRAVTVPGLRERWLPGPGLGAPETLAVADGQGVRYRMRDDEPPFVESVVTFEMRPNGIGGTRFRIVHERSGGPAARRLPPAANGNAPNLSLAA
jgi:uncharacterized protein YndB with AHSA1/START domain